MTPWALAGLLAGASLALALVLKVRRLGQLPQDSWAIGIRRPTDPLRPAVPGGGEDRPVLTAADIPDVDSDFVADPFLLHRDGRWHLFFEIMERKTWRGCLAVASSVDGERWDYGGVVLREPFHLSYPYVVSEGDTLYMVPESCRAGAIRLYRCSEFPLRWVFDRVLVEGGFYDPSLVWHGGRWWMFASDRSHALHLFHAPSLQGPWTAHAQSPVRRDDPRAARCGGRMLELDGALYRFAQDGRDGYGARLWAFRIDRLDEQGFQETEVPDGPVIGATGRGWTATGMHQLDVQRRPDGGWLATVDGNAQRIVTNWRAGVRQLQAGWFARR